MFARRGKYVVRKLPAGTVVGSATTLLDAADVAMEDARRGPGRYVIEQPPVEVDVSKAYGVLAPAGAAPTPPETPGELFLLGVGVTDASFECSAVPDATGYQWYLSGVPYQVTAGPEVYISGLSPATAYAVQVAAVRDGVSSAVSSSVSFTTEALAPPEWQAVPTQALTVGVVFDVDLAAYASSPGGDTPSFSLVSGALPAGLSIVGTRITGTPSAVETQTPVLRATAAGGTADSAAIVMESLNADVTAPDAPSGFAADGYSASQVRLSWTNPAGDAVVVGERKSGFLGIDVYRDGVKIDRVLASSATPEEYLAETTVTALWKARSVDVAFNKGPFTAELSAGPLAQSTAPGVPVSVAATRDSSTSATVTWAAGSGPAPTSYQVWMSLSLNGTYTQVGSPTGTSHTQTTGFTGSQAPYFYIVAVRGSETSAASAKVSAPLSYLGTVTEYFATSYEGADPTAEGMLIWSPTGRDAYDHTVDNMVEHSTLKAYKGSKSLRVQLTAHRFSGVNDFPQNNDAHLPVTPAPYRHYRKAAGDPNQIAHRNELKWPASGDYLLAWNTEHWLGLAVYLPGESDPDGDDPWRPVSFWSYSIGPQLHSAAGGPGSPLTLQHGSARWPWYANSLAGIPWPAGAPHVRYKRGNDLYDPNSSAFLAESASAAKLRVEWDAVEGASTYKVYRSVRSQGPWTEITASAGSITLDKTLRRYSEDDLGTNLQPTTNQSNAYIYVTAIVGGVESSPSFICPSGRHYWGISGYGASGASVAVACGDALDDLGTWVRFVIRYKLSTAGDGYVQAWKNGVEVAWIPSTNLGHSGSAYHYWRQGIYTNVQTENISLDPLVPADWAAREIVYYDALRMAKRTGGSNLRTDAGDPGYIAVDPERY